MQSIMTLTATLQTASGRRSFIRSIISAFERDDPIGSDLVVDEEGLLAAGFTAKPDCRLYYIERLNPAGRVAFTDGPVIKDVLAARMDGNRIEDAAELLYVAKVGGIVVYGGLYRPTGR